MFKGADWTAQAVVELYDLEQDPWEMKNLARDTEHAEVKGHMSRTLAQWMKDTDDPIINGPVQSPYFKERMRRFLAQ